MREGNVRPSESACGRPTPPPLGCVRSRERRAWPASAHVWDRTVRSGTRLLCPCITIGVAVVRVCATGFQPPWGPWPLRHVRRRTGCLRSVANVLEPVVWTTPQPSLGRNVVRMSQVLPSQGSANGWPSGYRHLDATHILGPVVLRRSCVSRCTRVSHTRCCWWRLAGATTYWSSSGGQLGSSVSMAPRSFGCLGGYQAHRHPRVRIVQAPPGTGGVCNPQVHTARWHTASSFHVNTMPIQFN